MKNSCRSFKVSLIKYFKTYFLLALFLISGCGDFSEVEEFRTIRIKVGSFNPSASSGKVSLMNSNLGSFNQIMAGVKVSSAGFGPYDVKGGGGVVEITVPVIQGESFYVGIVAWNCGPDTLCTTEAMSALKWYFTYTELTPSEQVQDIELFLGGPRPVNSSPWICRDDGFGGGTASNGLCETAEKGDKAKIVFFGPPYNGNGIDTGLRTITSGQVHLPNFGNGPSFYVAGERSGTNIGYRKFEIPDVPSYTSDIILSQ